MSLNLVPYINAAYPLILLNTQESHRAQLLAYTNLRDTNRDIYTWDILSGLQGISEKVRHNSNTALSDPVELFTWVASKPEKSTIVLAHNLTRLMDNIEVVQSAQNAIPYLKRGNCIIAISPHTELPKEIEPYFHIIDLKLPDIMRLENMMHDLSQSYDIEVVPEAAEAARGLTEHEAETAYAYSLATRGAFDPLTIASMKIQWIKKSGLMEIFQPTSRSMLGGLKLATEFLEQRRKAFLPGGEHLPKVKAILFVGPPGTGKSLFAKVAADIFGWWLIKLSFSNLKGELVGQSEKNTKRALEIIDAFGEAIIWVDEFEKDLGSAQAAEKTGDPAMAQLGQLLTWSQERTSPAILIATANKVVAADGTPVLPPELIRRFEVVFYVDLPSTQERSEIIEIMNRRYGSSIPNTMAQELIGWTGADIEKLARESMFTDSPEKAMELITPTAQMSKGPIEAIRQWAKSVRARPANEPETEGPIERKIQLAI